MHLSVVVPTLNGRDRLADCLDALAALELNVEVVVVNGPSADGTSGLAQDHDAVTVLLDVDDRNLNAARNAGIEASTGDLVALIDDACTPEDSWLEGVQQSLSSGGDVVAGPVHRAVGGGVTTQQKESTQVAGRDVTFFDGGNVAFTREVIDALDGFDEFLDIGGARDAAHRLAGMGYGVDWNPGLSVLRSSGDWQSARHTGLDQSRRGRAYRSLGYRLSKNYGPRPTVAGETLLQTAGDAAESLRELVSGDRAVSTVGAAGRDAFTNLVSGTERGLLARASDRTPRRNPNGISARMDRAVTRYDC